MIWNEGVHERRDASVARIYPHGIHGALASAVGEHCADGTTVTVRTLGDAGQGLRGEDLDGVDVLLWWGHAAHEDVADAAVDRIHDRVLHGMGLVVLHSGHLSKIFRRLMGTSCSLLWRSAAERELVWTVAPGHPIVEGVPSPVVIDAHEMYGEFFDIPQPDELVLISSFAGGEVFRGGCTWRRGAGRIAYLSPGDQEYPIYHHPDVRRLIANAATWAARRPAHDGTGPVSRDGARNEPRAGWYEDRS